MNFIDFREAIMTSPGPRTKREFITLYVKAFCMGIADLIPGVSGGTIAFITGIYEDVLDGISSLNRSSLGALFHLDFKKFLGLVHLRFLLPLFFGILSAIFLLARVMHFLMNEHPIPTWATFFGLIAASIVVIFKELEHPKEPTHVAVLLGGGLFAWLMVGLIPVETPNDLWFIYLCGIIGIMAMILPGLSGSFLLLILGKYEYITGAVKSPFDEGNFAILLIFAAGTVTGIMGFSRLLNWFLKHYRSLTMAFLTGVLLGSMKKVWPWKEVLETKVIRGKVRILREANILPREFNAEVVLAIILCLLGFGMVLLLEYQGRKQTSQTSQTTRELDKR